MSFISLFAVATASQLARASRLLQERHILVAGFLFFSICYFTFSVAGSAIAMVPGALCIGIGFGFTVPLLNHMVVQYSSHAGRGTNLGHYSMMIFAGQFAATFADALPTLTTLVFAGTAAAGLLISILLFTWLRKKLTFTA